MFEQIAKTVASTVAGWMPRDERYWRLDLYDRLLDGTFYDCLKYSFYQEMTEEMRPEMIPLEQRRPSSRFNLPMTISRGTSRKMFAGRHVPRVTHPDEDIQKRLRRLCRRAKLYEAMLEIAFRGSVGSVCATFSVYASNEKQRKNPNVQVRVWNSKFCVPTFNEAGELAALEIRYTTTAAALKAIGVKSELDPAQTYWYIRRWDDKRETVIDPILSGDWNPVEGFTDDAAEKKGFVELLDMTAAHTFGFVPAVWFKNLSGGKGIDGACTWRAAIHTSLDMDYTMSQLGRGVRYNAAPQLVTIGEVLNGSGDVVRSPMHHIQMAAGIKNEDGETYGEGDAKLLEMTGQGIEAGLKFVEAQRKLALEQIHADRKDPEQMKGPMSGRAMEYLDDGYHDLVMELRSAYGEYGFLTLLKKIAQATEKYSGVNDATDVEAIKVRWPRLFQPTPADLQQIIPALVLAMDPFAVAAQKTMTGGGGGEGAAPAKPAPQQFPQEGQQLLTLQEARAWLRDNMDIGVLDDDDQGDDEDDDDESPPAPGENLPPEPAPLFDGGGNEADPDAAPEGEEGAHPIAKGIAGGVKKVTKGRTK